MNWVQRMIACRGKCTTALCQIADRVNWCKSQNPRNPVWLFTKYVLMRGVPMDMQVYPDGVDKSAVEVCPCCYLVGACFVGMLLGSVVYAMLFEGLISWLVVDVLGTVLTFALYFLAGLFSLIGIALLLFLAIAFYLTVTGQIKTQ